MIEISEQQYKRLKQLHRNISYTKEEIDFLLEMTRKFVDTKAKVCYGCTNSISELKQKIYGWFLNNQTKIEEQLYPKEPELNDLEKAEKEVKDYEQNINNKEDGKEEE